MGEGIGHCSPSPHRVLAGRRVEESVAGGPSGFGSEAYVDLCAASVHESTKCSHFVKSGFISRYFLSLNISICSNLLHNLTLTSKDGA